MSDDNSATGGLRNDMLEFRAGFDSLNLATVSDAGVPEASAAPMVTDDNGAFYVLVSGLARHTANLQAKGRVGVLLIEPVEAAANPFARQRLSYQCGAEPVPRETDAFADILKRFKQQFGGVVEVLERLPDFRVFRLVPTSGTYVRGFGQAWHLIGPGLRDLQPNSPARDRSRDTSVRRGGQ